MPYRLKGILKLPNSAQVAAGVDIEFISRRNYSPLLMDLSSVIKTSSTGDYDITLEFGEYAVVLYWGCNQPSHIGKLFVFADTVEGLDLQTLLQQADWQPATPDYIQQIQEWLATASSAATSAVDSAAKAKASELLVEQDRAEVASNKAIVVNAQADVTNKRNDVTAKAQQVATNTATVNEKTPLAVAAADTASQKAAAAAVSDASARDAAARAENAATAMTGALLDGGQCNLSGGIYPPPLTVGGKKYSTVWYVQVGGVVGGTSFDAGDVLRYTAATNSYFKVDAVDTTTAQISAHKVDPSAHAINTIVGLQDALNNKYSPSNKPTAHEIGAVATNGLAEKAKYIPSVDLRSNTSPSAVIARGKKGMTSVFTSEHALGISGSAHTFVDLLYMDGWSDTSGGFISALAISKSDQSKAFLMKGDINTDKWLPPVPIYTAANKPTAADVGADPAGTAFSAILSLKAEQNPFPQYSDFVSGEPRMFESRVQLAKRSAQYHPLDGQLIPRSGDAGLLAAIVAGDVPSCSDADWLSDPKKRSNYTLGDGSTNIRLPDRNGKVVGTIGSVFARGDGDNSPAPGYIHNDTIRNFTGYIAPNVDGTTGRWLGVSEGEGVFKRKVTSGPVKNLASAGSDVASGGGISIDASLQVPTGPQNRPVSISQVWAVKR